LVYREIVAILSDIESAVGITVYTFLFLNLLSSQQDAFSKDDYHLFQEAQKTLNDRCFSNSLASDSASPAWNRLGNFVYNQTGRVA